jgi:hypothetical protein
MTAFDYSSVRKSQCAIAMTTLGWSNPLIWRAAAARNELRRAVNASRAARVLSQNQRLCLEQERLERNRKALVQTAARMSEDAAEAVRDALIQQILQYYQEVGEFEQAVKAYCLACDARGRPSF